MRPVTLPLKNFYPSVEIVSAEHALTFFGELLTHAYPLGFHHYTSGGSGSGIQFFAPCSPRG